MNKAYYYQYYNFERHHWWFRARAEILRSYIRSRILTEKKDFKILNVGAATGGLTEWLSSFGQVTSIEYDEDCIAFVKDKIKHPIERGTILALEQKDNSYDLVCAFDVIEHVEDDSLAVKELARVCKPGGAVLVTVPAFMHLWSPHDIVNQHFRRYTLPALKNVFGLSSGKIAFVSYFNQRLYPIIFAARKLGNIVNALVNNKKNKSDFESYNEGFLNNTLCSIMANERHSLNRHVKKSFGVSILLHWVKI